MEERAYEYWFYSLEYITETERKRLLDMCGHVREIFDMSKGVLQDLVNISERAKMSIYYRRDCVLIQKEMEMMQKKNINFVCMSERKFPKRLLGISNPPSLLYYKGKLPEEEKSAVAVIGARNCSAYGRKISVELGEKLGMNGINVVSGMARGIDGWAQKSSILNGGESFGVLGCGVDICYPKENLDLYEELLSKGGIISEFRPGMPAKSINFPQRNRIISGLSDAIIVVEAKKQSGTSITVGFGLDQGKEIFAVPGRVTDGLSEGCNYLIYQGANPVLDIEETVLELKKYEKIKGQKIKNKEKIKVSLESDQKLVYDFLDFTPKNIAQLAKELGEFDYEKLNSMLFDLEIEDKIEQISTGYYVRKK